MQTVRSQNSEGMTRSRDLERFDGAALAYARLYLSIGTLGSRLGLSLGLPAAFML